MNLLSKKNNFFVSFEKQAKGCEINDWFVA